MGDVHRRDDVELIGIVVGARLLVGGVTDGAVAGFTAERVGTVELLTQYQKGASYSPCCHEGNSLREVPQRHAKVSASHCNTQTLRVIASMPLINFATESRSEGSFLPTVTVMAADPVESETEPDIALTRKSLRSTE